MPRRTLPGVPGPGLTYRFAARVAFTIFDLQRWRFDVTGLEHVPRRGGAVIAANHISYWDYFTVGRPSYDAFGRPIRILAKEQLFRIPVFGTIMQRAGHIPVHRGSGADALRDAVAALRAGELVLVLPEQTISRSFELLPFKTGAARMAAAAGVPLIPAASWGSQRFHTMGHPVRLAWRIPVSVRYGEPLRPAADDDPDLVTGELRDRVERLTHIAQETYPDTPRPGDAWWQPARLGGDAPEHHDVLKEHQERRLRWQERAGDRYRRTHLGSGVAGRDEPGRLDRRDAS